MSAPRRKQAFGTIEKLPSGNFRVRYTGPDGVRYKATKTFSKRQFAETELRRLLTEIDTGKWQATRTLEAGDIDPKTLTLKELADLWRAQRVTAQGQALSPRTLNEYQRLIESTLAKFKDRPIREITQDKIEAWRAPEIKRAANQTTKAYKHLKTLMTFAHKRNWIAVNPCDLERATNYTPATKPPIPSKDQVELMLAEATGSLKAIVALASWGGLRKGEILELRRKDLEILKGKPGEQPLVLVHVRRAVIWENREAIVRPPKTAQSKRAVTLPPRVTNIILDHYKTISLDPEALLFERQLGTNVHWREGQLRTHWQNLRALAGFTGRFHSLRAFAATQFGLTEATAQEIMDRFGHKDIKTAMLYQRSTGREADLVRLLG